AGAPLPPGRPLRLRGLSRRSQRGHGEGDEQRHLLPARRDGLRAGRPRRDVRRLLAPRPGPARAPRLPARDQRRSFPMREFLNQWMPIDASAHGSQVDDLIVLTHWLMAVLFVIWGGYFLIALYRFSAKRHPRAD